jgi:hypothetical protein
METLSLCYYMAFKSLFEEEEEEEEEGGEKEGVCGEN